MLQTHDLRSDDAFERVQNGAGAKPVERIAPVKPLAEVDGIVVPIGVAESHQQPPADVTAEAVNQLLPQQAHRRRAQNHHALFMQADDAEIGAKVEELRQLQALELWRRCLGHVTDSMASTRGWRQAGHPTSSHHSSVRLAMTRSTLGMTSPLVRSRTIATRQVHEVKPNPRTFEGSRPGGIRRFRAPGDN